MKKVLEKTAQYEIYEDYSVKFICPGCNKDVFLDASSDDATKFVNNGENYRNGRTCLQCYKKGKDEERRVENEAYEEKIARGQAYNNAVSGVLAEGLTPLDKDKFWNRLSELEDQFYQHKRSMVEKNKK